MSICPAVYLVRLVDVYGATDIAPYMQRWRADSNPIKLNLTYGQHTASNSPYKIGSASRCKPNSPKCGSCIVLDRQSYVACRVAEYPTILWVGNITNDAVVLGPNYPLGAD